jgi:hypothetical protein
MGSFRPNTVEPMSEPIYVIGDSHVRTFSFSSHFVPLYIGAGFDNCFLTEQLAERTRVKLSCNLDRVPAGATVLLVLGEPDVRFQIEDRFGTRALTDARAIAAATARYVRTVSLLRRQAPRSTIAVLSCIPSTRPDYCELSAVHDFQLAPLLHAAGIPHVDIRSRLVDPATRLLRPEFDADGIHLSTAALPRVIAALKENALLAPGAREDPDFRWSFNYRIPLAEGIETRCWGDKQRSAVADAVVAHLENRHVGDKAGRWQVLDCAEGYLAFALARSGFREVLGIEPDPDKLRLARCVRRLFRGPEEAVVLAADDTGAAPADFALVYPWTLQDPATIAASLPRAARRGTVCYILASAADADRITAHCREWRAEGATMVANQVETMLLRYCITGERVSHAARVPD